VNEEASVKHYFAQPGFQRFLGQMQHQYMSSTSGARGYVTLVAITDEERRVLDEFYELYSPPKPDETKRYSIKKFAKHLLKSRFALTIPDLLTILNGESVRTRQEQRRIADAEWERVVQEAIEETGVSECDHSLLFMWAAGLRDESSPGARTLRNVFAKSAKEASCCLEQCLIALRTVTKDPDKRPIRLPVLAAKVTGDAHALDWKNPLGRLFWWGLTAIHEQTPSVDFEEDDLDRDLASAAPSGSQAIFIREGYRKGGIADDDLSSQVMLYAPELFGQLEERILTLRQVEQFAERDKGPLNPVHIFMVENPSVFAELVDADRQRQGARHEAASPIILCGNGQPTTAVIKFLDWLLESSTGASLNYAGDLDPAGLSIAQGLQLRYANAFSAWHMDKELYLRYAHKGIPLTEVERARLQQSQYDWDPELAHLMISKGIKLHQELWVDELALDMVNRNKGQYPTRGR
jgi:uncharacterized protein (TIGR02679 family)